MATFNWILGLGVAAILLGVGVGIWIGLATWLERRREVRWWEKKWQDQPQSRYTGSDPYDNWYPDYPYLEKKIERDLPAQRPDKHEEEE